MKPIANALHAIEHPGASTKQTIEASNKQTSSQPTPEQSLVLRLRGAIDKSGRYSHRLSDMTAGYSAGQNIPFADARKAIEEKFTAQIGVSPHQYLDRHYATLRQNAKSEEKGPAVTRPFEVDRDR